MREKRARSKVRGQDLPFLAFFVLFTAAALIGLLIGIGAAAASISKSFHESLHVRGLSSTFPGRLALGMADASHHSQPAGHLALDYLFSTFNLVLAGFLIWLRPRDRAARLLAIGMIGTAAVFNLQAASVYEAMPKTLLETTSFSGFRLVTGVSYVLALLLFPEGKLVPRWPRWGKTLLYLPALLGIGVVSFRIRDVQGSAGTVPIILFFGLFTPVSAVLSQAYRFRRSPTPEERAQSRLLFWALVPALIVGLFVLTQGVRSLLSPGLAGRPLQELPVFVFRVFQPVFALIPIALFVGILRYRLWNIDRVISRTLVYGALVGFITAVYVGVVVGLGRAVGARGNNLLLSITATGIVAFAFEPVKERLQRVANRLVYGRRATPYEVLSEFSERMAESYPTEELLTRMARILGEGTGASRAEVWLRIGSELRPTGMWPEEREAVPTPLPLSGDDLPSLDSSRAVPVRHQGELLGALTVTQPAGEELNPTEEKLLLDLASQAGLVLRNVALTAQLLERLEELKLSRQRLVAAQDEERRRLERDLHDGAQQQLVALKVKIATAEKIAESESSRITQMLAQLSQDTDAAVETLRDLARGIYPPLLQSDGLGAALRAHSRKVPIPVEVIGENLKRYPAQVEAAVYFCCLEALQNVAKSSKATVARVLLKDEDSQLAFHVEDDGIGFDVSAVKRGSGLQNMVDRVEALGGSLVLESQPGSGTKVIGRVPVTPAAQAPPG